MRDISSITDNRHAIVSFTFTHYMRANKNENTHVKIAECGHRSRCTQQHQQQQKLVMFMKMCWRCQSVAHICTDIYRTAHTGNVLLHTRVCRAIKLAGSNRFSAHRALNEFVRMQHTLCQKNEFAKNEITATKRIDGSIST